MGTNRLKRRPEGAAGTAPLKGTAKLKAKTGHLGDYAPSGFSTGQLRMPPSRRRRGARIRKAIMILSGLAFVGGLAAATMLMGASAFLDSFAKENRRAMSPADFARGLLPLAERQTILLMGTDIAYSPDGSRMTNGAVRSDTMMLLSVDAEGGKLDVVSIPRDTRAVVRGRWDKINSAFYQGGPKLAAEVVSDLMGVPVKRWAQVNTTGLEKLVDVVGGVRLYVDKDMNYVDQTAHLKINIKHGWQTLDGADAHRYVRFRHDELGDIGRVQRQQQFMRAAIESLLTPDTLLKIPQMMQTVQANLNTNLTGSELVQLATWGARLNRSNIHLVMLPGTFSGDQFSASYWLADADKARALGKRLMGREAPVTAKAPKARTTVTVLNGTLRPGLATSAARELREAGWNVHGVGDAPNRTLMTTRVIAQTGHTEWSASLGRDLGVEAERVDASVGDIATDFTVIVGDDYAGELGLASKR